MIITAGAALGLVAGGVIPAASAATTPAAAATPAARGTEITTHVTPFGTALVVGSGHYKGYSLYDITSDHPPSYGCPATVVPLPPIGFPPGFTCTGPSNDKNAEWPAITTTGAPVAGPGVTASLLGSVNRSHVGRQITYAGHPLYLFDSQAYAVTGEGWDEPSIPPWHGIWNLVQPSGSQLPWVATLTTVTLHGQSYLATPMETGVGWINFPVYSLPTVLMRTAGSRFTAVISAGHPGTAAGVNGMVGTTGVDQVTYNGHPLWFYTYEGLNATTLTATGNGAGVQGAALVSP